VWQDIYYNLPLLIPSYIQSKSMRLAWSSKMSAPWNKALLTVATATKLVNKFFIVYGTPRFITVSKAARH